MKVDLDDFKLYENEYQFKEDYPEVKYGEYRPQPWDAPEEYPCLVKLIGVKEEYNGADTAILSILYFEKE